MLSQAMTASTEMYKENGRIISLLDDKAQKTAGLAGLFLGAAFAFLEKDTLNGLPGFERIAGFALYALVIGLLLGCVFTAGLVLWARKLKTPPNPNKIAVVCYALLAAPDGPNDESRENHIRDQIRSWNRALSTQDRVITDKSRKLLIAQWLLIIAMAVVAALLVFLMFGAGTKEKSIPKNQLQLLPILGGSRHGTMRATRMP